MKKTNVSNYQIDQLLFGALNCSISIELQFRLFAATPPQMLYTKLQRGIRFYPEASEQ
jgi:hypothetical protein